jgi:hypothetical protein
MSRIFQGSTIWPFHQNLLKKEQKDEQNLLKKLKVTSKSSEVDVSGVAISIPRS